MVSLAATLGARVVIFHRASVAPSDKGEAFLAYAKSQRVETQLVLQTTSLSTAEAIFKANKSQGTDMIAMVSNRAPALALVTIGSVTRRVVRQASCPVWVIHPK